MNNGATAPRPPAAIYCRISRDPEGERAGVDRQEADCRALADRLGYAVAHVYIENDVGASTRSRKARPEYAAMLEGAQQGAYSAILSYSNSRLTRRPREVEDLLELAERHGVAIRTCVSGDWDLSTADGRAVARTIAAWDAAEAERISERVKRSRLAAARNLQHIPTRRRFGYSPDGTALVTREANALRAAYSSVLAGGTLMGLAREWTAQGIQTTQGGTRWTASIIRGILLNPRNAGLAVYHGEIVGEGDWPAIVPVETFEAMQALLANRKAAKKKTPRYMLSGLARCGVCGGPMGGGTTERGMSTYRCRTTTVHVTRKVERVDEYVGAVVVERLSRADARDLLTATDRPNVAELREQSRSIRARLDSLAVEFADGELTASQLRTATERLRDRLAEVDGELADAGRVDVLGPLIGEHTAEVWADLDTDRRRAVVALLMDVTILKTRRGAKSIGPDTIQIDWK